MVCTGGCLQKKEETIAFGGISNEKGVYINTVALKSISTINSSAS
jgi:hypothetical protein